MADFYSVGNTDIHVHVYQKLLIENKLHHFCQSPSYSCCVGKFGSVEGLVGNAAADAEDFFLDLVFFPDFSLV